MNLLIDCNHRWFYTMMGVPLGSPLGESPYNIIAMNSPQTYIPVMYMIYIIPTVGLLLYIIVVMNTCERWNKSCPQV